MEIDALIGWGGSCGTRRVPATATRRFAEFLLERHQEAANPRTSVFDLLETGGTVLLDQPYLERRALLEELFDRGVLGPPWSLCPATDDPAIATQWLTPDWGHVGIEGICLKPKTSRYGPGVRGWGKLRSFESAEGIVGGVTGPLASPGALLIGRYNAAGHLRLIARTTPLPRAAARQLGAILRPAGSSHPWEGVQFSSAWGSRETLDFRPAEPEVVVEFRADTAIDAHRYRHPVRHLRVRTDLRPVDIPVLGTEPPACDETPTA